MSADRKLAEGSDAIKQAEKCLKTGFLKWKPDFDNAASEYCRAATCFKSAKALEQCKDAHLKATDCYLKAGSFFSAGKQCEQAALVSRDMGDLKQTSSLVDRASRFFIDSRSPDTAALVLERGAKIIEAKFPEIAVEFFTRASEIVGVEDRPRQAADFRSQAVRILLKLKKWDEAAEAISAQQQLLLEGEDQKSAARLAVGLILVQLARDDPVAASRVFKNSSAYMESEEQCTLSELLDGYDEGDPDAIVRALNRPFVKHMDTEFAKLARILQQQQMAAAAKQEEETSRRKKTESVAVPQVEAGEGEGANIPPEDEEKGEETVGAVHESEDDEYAGGLL
ncbi:gamma-soluble NSF attachment protein-like [Ornithodoros turicata]